jgi:predicted HTH transcriptional regulator
MNGTYIDDLLRRIRLGEDSTLELKRVVWRGANGYFRRIGHSKRPMPPDMLARLFQQRSQARLIRFEEQAVPGASPEDLDPLLLRSFVRPGEGLPEVQLRRLHLLTDVDGVPHATVAGVLLGTVRPTRWLPSAYIQAVAYRGVDNDPAEQLDAKDFEGPIHQQIWDAFDFVRLHMRVPAGKNLGRIDYPQYSTRAVFEAIVNAVAHRDYSMVGGRIRLHLFADRLELYSPGALPNSMSIEAMTSVSIPRNELIASIFARYFSVREAGLGREYLMDRRGAGVDVILRESERLSGQRPVYDNLGDVELRLTLFPASPPSGVS